jgi:hypothetical protein
MRYFLTLLVCALLIAACRPTAGSAKINESTGSSNDTLFYQRRGSCYGRCPVFEFVIYRDGRSVFVGTRNVRYEGTYQTTFSSSDFQSILDVCEEIGFMQLEERYDNEMVTDLPTIITVLNLNGHRKQVEARYKAPGGLNMLNDAVDEVIDGAAWTKMTTKE